MSSTVELNPFSKKPYSPVAEQRREAARKLPVRKDMPAIEQVINDNAVTVLVGETGSGKTTQVGQRMAEERARKGEKKKRIVITQPTVFAANLVSRHRIALCSITLSDAYSVLGRGSNCPRDGCDSWGCGWPTA